MNISRQLVAIALTLIITTTVCQTPSYSRFLSVEQVLPPDVSEEAPMEENPLTQPSTETEEETTFQENPIEEVLPPPPVVKKLTYFSVATSGVNLRSGAGTQYAVLGTAATDSLYPCLAVSGAWYQTYYRGKIVYIASRYCRLVEMEAVGEEVEAVIKQGCKWLGTPYVYGATRYHDGNGVKIKGFTTEQFDCSSLMQYIFSLGAGVNLQVTTRTQVSQGQAVSKSQLRRGDLLFFTNASRKNLTGVERIGHVALYLGDNLILHTASDYAKIEPISSARWGYFITARRVL